MKRFALVTLACSFAVVELNAGGAPAAAAHAMAEKKAAGAAGTIAPCDLRSAMRKLWEDHIEYTRNFIISALAGLDDTSKIAERLLRNQDDIGDAVKPFYGDDAGKKLSALLRDHILIAADIVKAAKAGNNPGVEAGEKKWHGNADDLAAFLSAANPNWGKPALTDMLYKHLEFTTTEVVVAAEEGLAGRHQGLRPGPRPHADVRRHAHRRRHQAVPQEVLEVSPRSDRRPPLPDPLPGRPGRGGSEASGPAPSYPRPVRRGEGQGW